jgi:hypothetical protein
MKIRVVRFCTVPLVAPSKKHLFWPLRPLEKCKMHFLCGNPKNTSYKSCWPCRDAHLCQKWDHGSIVCYGTCTILGHLGRSPRDLLPGSTSLWKSSPVNPCMPCLVFFLGATSHTMTPCNVFPFFWIFLNTLSPPSRSRSNSRCLRCLPGGLGTQVWCWF